MRSSKANSLSLSLFKLIAINPDITFLIDMDPEIALSRALSRKTDEERFENYGINFQYKLRKNFLDIANKHKHRIKIINGDQCQETIASQIIETITALVP